MKDELKYLVEFNIGKSSKFQQEIDKLGSDLKKVNKLRSDSHDKKFKLRNDELATKKHGSVIDNDKSVLFSPKV